MASADSFEPVSPRELRILVLHNRDFATEPPPGAEHTAEDMDRVARADVLNTVQHVTRALAARGHFVEVKGIDTDDIADFVEELRRDRPDLIFNLCESLGGDDRNEIVVPTLLELYGIPYTGTGPLGLGLGRDKYRAKYILRAAAIPTPLAALVSAAARSRSDDLAAVESIGYPLFLKLAELDGSVGVSSQSIVRSDEELVAQIDYLRARFHQPILAERYIEGREVYVSMLGNRPPRLLPIQEIDFSRLPSDKPQIVSENAKWNSASIEYQTINSIGAAPMSATVKTRILEVAQKAFALLDIRDYGRCDMRLSDDGTPYVIDINPNCDLSDGAGFSRAGLLAEIPYDRLIEEIALAAHQRTLHAHAQRTGDAGNQPADSP